MAVLESPNTLEKVKFKFATSLVMEQQMNLTRRGSESINLEIENYVKPHLFHFFREIYKYCTGRFQLAKWRGVQYLEENLAKGHFYGEISY